jgi:hypothetical protein
VRPVSPPDIERQLIEVLHIRRRERDHGLSVLHALGTGCQLRSIRRCCSSSGCA